MERVFWQYSEEADVLPVVIEVPGVVYDAQTIEGMGTGKINSLMLVDNERRSDHSCGIIFAFLYWIYKGIIVFGIVIAIYFVGMVPDIPVIHGVWIFNGIIRPVITFPK